MNVFLRAFLVPLWVVALPCLLKAAESDDAKQSGQLVLRDGSLVQGDFRSSESPNWISWQAESFVRPFEFQTSNISSINFPVREELLKMEGEFAVELQTGDQLSGMLKQWSKETLTLESERLGLIRIRQDAIRRLDRIEGNPTVLFSGLSGLGDWKIREGDWTFAGAELWTADPDSYLIGDFDLPDRVMVDFAIQWETTPNFSFSIGLDPTAIPKTSSGWSFDTWNSQITLVRERDDIAAIEPVAKVSDTTKQIELIAFLDRIEETIRIYEPGGKLLAESSLPPQKDSSNVKDETGIIFASHFGQTKLSRLRIMRWDGSLPVAKTENAARFRLKDGATLRGNLTSFNPDRRELSVQLESESRTLSLDQLLSIEYPNTNPENMSPVTVNLQNRCRVSGTLQSVDERQVTVLSPELVEPLSIPRELIRVLVNRESQSEKSEEIWTKRVGRLEVGSHVMRGSLVPGKAEKEASCLVWHPKFSRNASPLERSASGRIVYEERKPKLPEKTTTTETRNNNPFAKFGQLFLKKAAQAGQQTPAQSESMHNLHLISGDMLPCRVVAIDERGVHIDSEAAETKLIPHEKVKALVLDKKAKELRLDEEKKARLLTLPRNQKSSPPTHLLYSPEGDYLRCRLMTYSPEQLKIEVHLTEMNLPSNRISHIIWLHPEDILQKNDETPDPDAPLVAEKPQVTLPNELHQVQVIFADGNRSTFDPVEVTDQRIVGISDVIGQCSYELVVPAEIAFGDGIQVAAGELPYHQWVLTPAPEPLYVTAAEGGPGNDGLTSSFVGKPAPDFQLEMLSGDTFVLSEQQGKIIVLDFWATWCGPCILTMPILEEAMKQFPPEQVELISVNLEERPEQIRAVRERHKLNAKVALDIDGAIARRYQVDSIPQLMVIDREGNVARLYIGGGQNVVDQCVAAIQELLAGLEKNAEP
ncbi:MAG: redoxin domain-containing protein [Planctomycetaceae bacterium]|nr:redoxin domain-containing protein [Planctomycetaceae bacterium]